MLKILMVAYSCDKEDISEALMAYEWIVRLSKYVELWVVTAGSRTRPICGLEDLPNVHLVLVRPTLGFQWLGIFDRAVKPAYFEFYLRARHRIREILTSESIDLCHHFSPRSVRMPSPFQGLDHAYVIGPLHGGLHPPSVMKELEGKEESFFLLRKLDALRASLDPVLRNTFKNAKVTLVSAPYVQEISPVHLSQNHVVIPGIAVDMPERYPSSRNPNAPVQLIFSGRLVASKGLELLIEGVSRCMSENIVLYVYGCGENEAYYQELVRRMGLESKIRLEGFVQREYLLRRYQECDVFIFPSLKEPMGVVVLEAMAAGLPIICVDSGGPAYIVSEDVGIKIALACRERMTHDIAAAIDRLAQDPVLRAHMGRNAHARVAKEFTWGSVMEKMRELYQQHI